MIEAKFLLFVVFVGVASVAPLNAAISCRNQENVPVEWFAVYKVPAHSKGWEDAATGSAFIYQDAVSPGNWKRSSILINSTNQLVAHTLSQLYQSGDDEKVSFILYNQNNPVDKKTHESYGHAGGFLIFDDTTGIWVTHTVPYFPPKKSEGYSYPSGGHNANIYGQSLFCASFPISEIDKIARQLWYINPLIYDKKVPATVAAQNRNLNLLLNGEEIPESPFQSTVHLNGVSGTRMISFAKDSRLNTEMYAYLVAPTLNSGMIVQSWRHGEGNLPSTCSTPSTTATNVKDIKVAGKNAEWSTAEDHANWAVSSDSSKAQWTCFGDLSRQLRSFERSGGVFCIQHHGLWLSYRKLVSGVDACNRQAGVEIEAEFGLHRLGHYHLKRKSETSPDSNANMLLRHKRGLYSHSHDRSYARDYYRRMSSREYERARAENYANRHTHPASSPTVVSTRQENAMAHALGIPHVHSGAPVVTSPGEHALALALNIPHRHAIPPPHSEVIVSTKVIGVPVSTHVHGIPVVMNHASNAAAHALGIPHAHASPHIPTVHDRTEHAIAHDLGVPHRHGTPIVTNPIENLRAHALGIPHGHAVPAHIPTVHDRTEHAIAHDLGVPHRHGTPIVTNPIDNLRAHALGIPHGHAGLEAVDPYPHHHHLGVHEPTVHTRGENLAAHALGIPHHHGVPVVTNPVENAHAHALGIPHGHSAPLPPPHHRHEIPVVENPTQHAIAHAIGLPHAHGVGPHGRLHSWERSWSREHSWGSYERHWSRRQKEVVDYHLSHWTSREKSEYERMSSGERHAWFRNELRRRWDYHQRRRLAHLDAIRRRHYLASRERSAEHYIRHRIHSHDRSYGH